MTYMSADSSEHKTRKTRNLFIPRFDKYMYPLDQDYEHFIDCDIRKSGKLYECDRCKYVWDHWYGTDIPFLG